MADETAENTSEILDAKLKKIQRILRNSRRLTVDDFISKYESQLLADCRSIVDGVKKDQRGRVGSEDAWDGIRAFAECGSWELLTVNFNAKWYWEGK